MRIPRFSLRVFLLVITVQCACLAVAAFRVNVNRHQHKVIAHLFQLGGLASSKDGRLIAHWPNTEEHEGTVAACAAWLKDAFEFNRPHLVAFGVVYPIVNLQQEELNELIDILNCFHSIEKVHLTRSQIDEEGITRLESEVLHCDFSTHREPRSTRGSGGSFLRRNPPMKLALPDPRDTMLRHSLYMIAILTIMPILIVLVPRSIWIVFNRNRIKFEESDQR